jgi:lysophospholipase L1-like esterase
MGALRRWGARLAVAGVSLLLALALLEGAVRLFLPQQLLRFHPEIWVPEENGLGHGLRPNLDTRVNTGEREVRFRTDALGHRVGADDEEPADLHVLALGDSFLEAMAVPYEDTMTARIGRELGAALGLRVRVVNTGVSGTSPNRYLREEEIELARRPYDAVLVFLFLGNDILHRRVGFQPPRQPTPHQALHLPRSLSAREWVDGVAHPLWTELRERSQLAVLLKDRLLGVLVRMGITDHSFPTVFLRASADSPRFRLTAEVCADIDRQARERGIPALFVLLPPDYVVDPELGRDFARGSGLDWEEVDLDQPARLLGERFAELGLRFLDLTPALRRLRAQGEALYGRVDRHLNPRGHAAVAEAVAPSLLELLRAPGGAAERGTRG